MFSRIAAVLAALLVLAGCGGGGGGGGGPAPQPPRSAELTVQPYEGIDIVLLRMQANSDPGRYAVVRNPTIFVANLARGESITRLDATGDPNSYSFVRLTLSGSSEPVPATVLPMTALPSVPPKPTGMDARVSAPGPDGAIVLRWSAAPRADVYEIQGFNSGSSSIVATVNATGYEVAPLKPGSHSFRVRARNAAGSSDLSDEASATIPPGAPQNLQASASGIVPSATVFLTWDESEGADEYRIYRALSSIDVTSGTSYEDVNPGFGPISYHVIAVGTEAASAASETAIVIAGLAVPAGVIAVVDGVGPSADVSVSWERVEHADRYSITRDGVQQASPSANSYVDPNPGIGVHSYKVAAISDISKRIYDESNAVAVTIAPAVPAGLQATPMGSGSTGDIKLDWGAVDGATEYRIYLDGSEVATVAGPSYTHEDPGPGTYAFRVAAFANGVLSALSDLVSTGIISADFPTGFTATPSGFGSAAEVALAWDPVDGVQGYRIYRDGAEIASTADTRYTDSNPGLGNFIYQVSAYSPGGETDPSAPIDVQIKSFDGVQGADGSYEELELPEPEDPDGVEYAFEQQYIDAPLGEVGADQAYKRGYFGQGVTVAIVDEGFATGHPELAANMLAGLNVEEIGQPIPTINVGHGSWVARALGGVRNGESIQGIAPSVTMMPYHHLGGGNEKRAYEHAISLNIPIINNSWGYPITAYGRMELPTITATIKLDMAVGPELLAHPSCLRCVGILDFFADYAAIAENEDVVFVWAAGNEGWSSDAEQGFMYGLELQELPDGKLTVSASPVRYSTQEVIDGFTILPLVVDEPYFAPTFSAPVVLSTLGLPLNSITDITSAPSFESSLLGKWVSVIGVDSRDRVMFNGCGSAKYYCMGAPGETRDFYENIIYGTSFAAPLVSGALALMRNRFPDMPMHAILAIVFHTAEDLGDPGIDELYGRGMLDVAAAVTVQGTVAVVLDEPGTARRKREQVARTHLRLPAALSGLAARARSVSVAVDYLGGNYYDMPLSGLFKEPESWRPPLGSAAANMLAEPDMQHLGSGFAAAADLSSGELLRASHVGPFWKLSYDKCRDCAASGWREYRSARIAAPFFDAGGEAAIGEIELGQGWSAFAAAGFAKQLDDMRYRQMGARWQAKPAGSESWAAQLELSRSDESNALLGGEYGGALAVGDASTYQARILGELALGADWTLAGSYLAGWTEGAAKEGSMISAIGDIRFAGWRAYLEGRSLLYAEDTMRIGLVRQAAVSGGSLSIRRGVVDGDPTFSDEHYMNTNTQYSVAETVLELDQPGALVAQFGYAITPRPGMRAAVGLERASGSDGDHDTAASIELRWDL